MTIPSPNLDDRTFKSLVDEAIERVRAHGGAWNELSASDPGTIIIEAFAYLTELLLYRVNRVPEKAYIEFLRLLGLSVGPPSAARAKLRFTLDDESAPAVILPAGIRVQADDASGGEPVVFVTDAPVTVQPGEAGGAVSAHNCLQIEGELLGRSNGDAGQRFMLANAPVIARSGHELDLVIGVEADADELEGRPNAREHEGVAYIIWPEVEHFTEVENTDRAVMVDRASGSVTFAPAIRMPFDGGGVAQFATPIAAVPPKGKSVRAWYRWCADGAAGNVAPRTITNVLDATDVAVSVINPERATGGRSVETVDQAITRAAGLFHEPRRAVTADDFEALAVAHGGVSRARAITSAEYWTHASPGEVDIRLVPTMPSDMFSPTADEILEMTDQTTVEAVRAMIERRQPLGVATRVGWAHYKRVSVNLRVVVSRSENAAAVRTRVADRLQEALSPVPTDKAAGWPFGQALRASNVYDIALREPGVRYADSVVMEVDETPDEHVPAIAADPNQPDTWYASEESFLFRSENDGEGWEVIWAAPLGLITRIVPALDRPGRLAVVVDGADGKSSRLYVSADCGSLIGPDPIVAFSWEDDDGQAINDVYWLPAGSDDDLVLATDRGLYRFRIGEVAPRPWLVDPENPGRGCWAVNVAGDVASRAQVVVAMKQRGGIWLSDDESFSTQGLVDVDVRRLIVERRGNRSFVWAPAFAVGDDVGTGCHRAEIVAGDPSPLRWQSFDEGWNGGICWDLAFLDDVILAASEFNGILTRPYREPETPWRGATLDSGLPLQDDSRLFHRVSSVAAFGPTAMVGTRSGIYRTADGHSFVEGAPRRSNEIVTIPAGWLFASGDHVVDVVVEDR